MSEADVSGGSVPWRDVELGFMFDHDVLASLSRQLLAARAAAVAARHVLVDSGLVTEGRFDELVEAEIGRFEAEEREEGLLLLLAEGDDDKYSIDGPQGIDCASRVALCRAACCTLRFALSRQDVEEGVIRFDLGRPYLNRVTESGYCLHLDDVGYRCALYDSRPAACRRYDCREDRRIWLDFEARVPNPALAGGGAVEPAPY